MKCYGDLDMGFYSERRPPGRVTISGSAAVPNLKLDLFSLNEVQPKYKMFIDHTGAYTLEKKLHLKGFTPGINTAEVRVPLGGHLPPIVPALIRSGSERSIDVNDVHAALGHTHDANAAKTSRQRQTKVTRLR